MNDHSNDTAAECELCGHAYTSRYMTETFVPFRGGEVITHCHDCSPTRRAPSPRACQVTRADSDIELAARQLLQDMEVPRTRKATKAWDALRKAVAAADARTQPRSAK